MDPASITLVLIFGCRITINLFYTLTWLFWRLAKKKCHGQFSKSTVKSFILTQTTKNFNKIILLHEVGTLCRVTNNPAYQNRSSILCHGAVYCAVGAVYWSAQYTALVPDCSHAVFASGVGTCRVAYQNSWVYQNSRYLPVWPVAVVGRISGWNFTGKFGQIPSIIVWNCSKKICLQLVKLADPRVLVRPTSSGTPLYNRAIISEENSISLV